MNVTPTKKFVPKEFRNAGLLERPERPRSLNQRRPNQHLKGVNEFGIPVPSNNINDYVPGLNNTALLFNSSGRSYMNNARNAMKAAKNLYIKQRETAIQNLEENMAGAPPRKRGKYNSRRRRMTRRNRATRTRKNK